MIPPAGWRKGRLWADAEDSRRSYMLERSGGLAKEAALQTEKGRGLGDKLLCPTLAGHTWTPHST